MKKVKVRRARTVTSINGKMVPRSKAVISVFDNSLLYGEGLFETCLAVDNRVLFHKEHLDRLERGAKVTELKLPVERRTLLRWMVATAAAHPAHIKQLRLTLTSGESVRYVGVAGAPQLILSAAPYRMVDRPYRILVSDWRVDQDSSFRRVKTLSYAINAAALRTAISKGFDEALLINEDGNVAEATSSNIFWVRKGRIYTPPLSAGCLEGTTRKTLLKIIRRRAYRMIEKSEPLERLAAADEVFITSSLKLVAPVGEIRHRKKSYEFAPGPVTEELAASLRRKVGL